MTCLRLLLRLTRLRETPRAKPLARFFDLLVLAARAVVSALVVAVEQEDDLLAVEVHEQPEQDLRGLGRLARAGVGVQSLDGRRVVSDPELMESFTEGLQPRRAGECDAVLLEDLLDRGCQRFELDLAEITHPDLNGTPAIGVLVELGGPRAHSATVPVGSDTNADKRRAISASRSAAACWSRMAAPGVESPSRPMS